MKKHNAPALEFSFAAQTFNLAGETVKTSEPVPPAKEDKTPALFSDDGRELTCPECGEKFSEFNCNFWRSPVGGMFYNEAPLTVQCPRCNCEFEPFEKPTIDRSAVKRGQAIYAQSQNLGM